MRLLPAALALPVALVAAALLAACDDATTATVPDASPLEASFDAPASNSCLVYGPPGSVCKGNGVCGSGFTYESSYLCAESVEVCCWAAFDAGMGDAQVPFDSSVPDGAARDAAHDARHDAGHDATISDSGHDAGHDAGHDSGHAGHDAGHDSGHDAGHDSGHDSGHDAGHDSGHDAGHEAGDAS